MKVLRVEAASANIAYHDIPGTGTPLVFIHGIGCASSCDYPRIVSDPALAGRRAILVDLLGSGFSERPPDFAYSIDAHAEAVTELARQVCPGPVAIFGHSMGGAVAIALAAKLGERAERLVLGEPNLDPGGGFFSRKIAAIPEADYVARGHREIAQAARADGNAIWAASMSIAAPFAVHREAVSLIEGTRPSWREMLYGLPLPRTVLFGERSLPDPDFESLPQHGCQVDVIPDAGHSMAWDNPAGLAAALAKALT